MRAMSFVVFFCQEMGGEPDQIVNRIEFEHVAEATP